MHLAAYDTSFAVVSRAPLAKIEPYRKRLGWTFRWLSSEKSDFNYDYGVSFTPEQGPAEYNYAKRSSSGTEAPGASVFLRDGDQIFHTYSTYARGLDILLGAYNYLDLTPLGRQEEVPMERVRRHDQY